MAWDFSAVTLNLIVLEHTLCDRSRARFPAQLVVEAVLSEDRTPTIN
ncbi:MAG TPA: hypothetical protein V6C90_09425 [Coleofasciculaceae cyanobacterium]